MGDVDTTQICVSVTGRTIDDLRAAARAAERGADLVELRLDSMTQPAIGDLLGRAGKPAIVTCRPVRFGGLFTGSDAERRAILVDAAGRGAAYVDVDWGSDAETITALRGARMILSHHDFTGVPDAAAILTRMRAVDPACILKLAVMIDRLADLRALVAGARRSGVALDRTLLVGMGDAGIATRALAARFSAPWTYAGDGVAPGQVPAQRLVDEYGFGRAHDGSKVYGLLGRPIGHSLSPAMHNAGLAAAGIDATYVPLDTADLEELRPFAEDIGLAGASVTIPFKRAILPFLDDLDPAAAAAGAVNTVTIRNGRWMGANTDADGFMQPLRRRVPELRHKRAVVLGAGGAARAVALALKGAGAEVRLAARRRDAAEAAAAAIGVGVCDWSARHQAGDLLINATPIGSRAMPGSPLASPPNAAVVYDLVYDPQPTALIREAAAAGCMAIGGLEMLVAQAERQFDIWTGTPPPAGIFQQAAEAALLHR